MRSTEKRIEMAAAPNPIPTRQNNDIEQIRKELKIALNQLKDKLHHQPYAMFIHSLNPLRFFENKSHQHIEAKECVRKLVSFNVLILDDETPQTLDSTLKSIIDALDGQRKLLIEESIARAKVNITIHQLRRLLERLDACYANTETRNSHSSTFNRHTQNNVKRHLAETGFARSHIFSQAFWQQEPPSPVDIGDGDGQKVILTFIACEGKITLFDNNKTVFAEISPHHLEQLKVIYKDSLRPTYFYLTQSGFARIIGYLETHADVYKRQTKSDTRGETLCLQIK